MNAHLLSVLHVVTVKYFRLLTSLQNRCFIYVPGCFEVASVIVLASPLINCNDHIYAQRASVRQIVLTLEQEVKLLRIGRGSERRNC